MTNVFDAQSMDRIGNTVRQFEQLDLGNNASFADSNTNRAPIYHAIANEAIAAGAVGEVELLDPDRATRSGSTVQAYTDCSINQDQKCVIVWSAAKKAVGGGAAQPERWYVIVCGEGGDVICGPDNGGPTTCANIQEGTYPTNSQYVMKFDRGVLQSGSAGDDTLDQMIADLENGIVIDGGAGGCIFTANPDVHNYIMTADATEWQGGYSHDTIAVGITVNVPGLNSPYDGQRSRRLKLVSWFDTVGIYLQVNANTGDEVGDLYPNGAGQVVGDVCDILSRLEALERQLGVPWTP